MRIFKIKTYLPLMLFALVSISNSSVSASIYDDYPFLFNDLPSINPWDWTQPVGELQPVDFIGFPEPDPSEIVFQERFTWFLWEEGSDLATFKPHIYLPLENPTTEDHVSVDVWSWFSSSAYRFAESSFTIDDGVISVDVIVEDLRGSGNFFAQAAVGIGDTIDLGSLELGNYTIEATFFLLPWEGTEPELYGILESFSFDVITGAGTGAVFVPEPATICLWGLGLLTLRLRKKKQLNFTN